MPRTHCVKRVELSRSARVMQVESLFDVPPKPFQELTWDVELPIDDLDWHVGLIVGPSGCGKTTIARALWPDAMIDGFDWSLNRAVVDDFPAAMGVKDVVGLLNAVGFSSPPNWLRPYSCLSTGEQFRVTIARALAELPDLAVIDEFTSVVDRQVAQIASHSVQKAVRRTGRKLVAVSCHEDILDWLQPDWVYQPQIDVFTRRSPQRHPDLQLDLAPVDKSVWKLFAPHHYMSADLSGAARCFGAFIDGRIVAFTSYVHFPHPKAKDIKMGHRLVVLPDYQGMGIAGELDDWLGDYLHDRGFRYHNVVAHPAMIAHYSRSPRWKLLRSGVMSAGARKHVHQHDRAMRKHHARVSAQRYSASFAYIPKGVES